MAVIVAVALAGDVAIAVLAVALVVAARVGVPVVALTNRGGARLLGGSRSRGSRPRA